MSRARDVSIACGVSAVALGGLVLLGWALDVGFLKSPLAGRVSMKPITALSIALAGGSLLLLLSSKTPLHRIGGVLALGPLSFGLITLVEWGLDRDLGIDQLLFTEPPGTVGTSAPGRMAVTTAISLALLGAALLLLLLDRTPGAAVSQTLSAMAGFIGLLGLLPYLYGSQATSGLAARQTQMAVHTAVGVMVLGTGVLLARPDRGLTRILTRAGAGGVLARRLLPVVIGLPVLLGWLAVEGQRLGLYDSGFRASVVTATSAATLATLMWVAAHFLGRADERRELSERLRADMFRSNPSAAWITRMSDGLFVDVNQAFADTFGWAREDLIGRISLELNIWADPGEREAVMQMLRERGTVEGVEASFRDSEGRSFPALFAAKMVELDGEPHVVDSLQDITERKRAEELLRQREAELREAQRIAQVGSWTLDSATNHVSWTDELYLMLGLDPGVPPPDYTEHQRLFTPESWARLSTALPRTQETGVPYELELEMVRADGSTGWMLARGEPVRDASGAIVGLRGVTQDISERKRAEEELRRSERRLVTLHAIGKAILSAGSTEEVGRVGLALLRERFPFVRASLTRFSPETQELTIVALATEKETEVGLGARFPLSAVGSPDRLLRGEINRVPDTREVEDPAPSVRRLIEEGMRAYVNIPMVAAGELIGTLNMSVRDPHGFDGEELETATEVADLLTVAVVQSDLRDELLRHAEDLERQVAERTAALSESEARFRSLLAHAPDGVLLVDPAGVIELANDTAATLFGYEVIELLGMSVETLVPDSLRTIHATHRERYSTDPVARPMEAGFALRGRRKDGTEFPADISLSSIPARNAHGEPNVIAFVRDVTERKRVEEEVVAAKEEAERANRAKDEFLSRMSHELRTPLNAVLGFAQVLEMEELPTEQHDSVRQIRKGGQHLLELIDEVLDISRIASGGLQLSLEPVGVSEALRDVIDLTQPLAAERGITLRLEDPNGLHVLADRQRLKQVLLNLLSNAIKYNREGGKVDVSWAKAPEGRLRIRVGDTGPGIPPDRMGQAFVPFDRLGVEGGGVAGTGLGLSLSKGLAEGMGGSLEAESEVGIGSVFTLELSLAEPPAQRYERERREDDRIEKGGEARTVLCVEDNLSNLRLIERILERRPGVHLLTAMQGNVGIDLARQHQPDLILLDLHLPDIDGKEALRRLREDPTTTAIPVVVISADATPALVKTLLAAGAREFVTKPIDVKRFLQVVDDVLRGPGDG